MFMPQGQHAQQPQQQQQRRREFGKYQYFDFENRWQQKVSGDDIEMDLNQIENELIVQLSDNLHGVPGSHQGSSHARGGMLQSLSPATGFPDQSAGGSAMAGQGLPTANSRSTHQ